MIRIYSFYLCIFVILCRYPSFSYKLRQFPGSTSFFKNSKEKNCLTNPCINVKAVGYSVNARHRMMNENILDISDYHHNTCNQPSRRSKRSSVIYGARFPADDDVPSPRKTPRPKIISPSRGVHPELDKMMMMYTCKICKERNAQMITKVAYEQGMVVSTCKQCKNKHLIADNQGKLDFPSFGKKIEDFLAQKGAWL